MVKGVHENIIVFGRRWPDACFWRCTWIKNCPAHPRSRYDRFRRGWGDDPTPTYIYSAARFPSDNLTTEVEGYLSSIARSPALGNEERCMGSCTLKYDREGSHRRIWWVSVVIVTYLVWAALSSIVADDTGICNLPKLIDENTQQNFWDWETKCLLIASEVVEVASFQEWQTTCISFLHRY